MIILLLDHANQLSLDTLGFADMFLEYLYRSYVLEISKTAQVNNVKAFVLLNLFFFTKHLKYERYLMNQFSFTQESTKLSRRS